MDPYTPSPQNPLEKLFSKLYLAMTGYTSSLKMLDQKIEEQSSKIDMALQLLQASTSDSRVVAEQIDRLIEFERNEHEAINKVRDSLEEQHRRLISTGHEIVEARKDLDVIAESGPHSLVDDDSVISKRGLLITWGAAWTFIKKAAPILLPTGGAAVYHVIRTLLQ